MLGHALGPEERLGGAQHKRIAAVVERVAQDDVNELIDEDVRKLGAAPHHVEIGGFNGAAIDQKIAERGHHLPVFAGVRVGNPGDLGRRHRPSRIGEQRGVERTLGVAGFGRRSQFRPRQIGLEEIVGHHQTATVVAVEQMVSAGQPEVSVSCCIHDVWPLTQSVASYHGNLVRDRWTSACQPRLHGAIAGKHVCFDC